MPGGIVGIAFGSISGPQSAVIKCLNNTYLYLCKMP